MSISILSRVKERSNSKHSDRLVLLALADYANEEGQAWPSVASLTQWANVSERAVQASLKALADAGEITVEIGAGPRGWNLYRVHPGGANFAGVQTLRGAKSARGGANNVAKGVQTLRRGGADFAPNPSVEPLVNPSVEPSVVVAEATTTPTTDANTPKSEEDPETGKGEETVKAATPSRKPRLADDAWLAELSQNPTYRGIDVPTLYGKMCVWCEAHGKVPTRVRFVGWLNRERPMTAPLPGEGVTDGRGNYRRADTAAGRGEPGQAAGSGAAGSGTLDAKAAAQLHQRQERDRITAERHAARMRDFHARRDAGTADTAPDDSAAVASQSHAGGGGTGTLALPGV